MPGRRMLMALTLLASVCCTGCFKVEETLTLQEDGSGTVRMRVLFP